MIDFFTKAEGDEVIAAIRQAELNTSGEIRVHIEAKCKGEIVYAARKTFKRLKMQHTKDKNGVLFFIAPERKEFAVIGDEGIDKIVPEHFWEDIRDALQQNFKHAQFKEGVIAGIKRVGEKLKDYFPYQEDDENELPDEISYGGQ
ncbi:MAG: TPM domain-containing protein [Bacteroidota bacterium]